MFRIRISSHTCSLHSITSRQVVCSGVWTHPIFNIDFLFEYEGLAGMCELLSSGEGGDLGWSGI